MVRKEERWLYRDAGCVVGAKPRYEGGTPGCGMRDADDTEARATPYSRGKGGTLR